MPTPVARSPPIEHWNHSVTRPRRGAARHNPAFGIGSAGAGPRGRRCAGDGPRRRQARGAAWPPWQGGRSSVLDCVVGARSGSARRAMPSSHRDGLVHVEHAAGGQRHVVDTVQPGVELRGERARGGAVVGGGQVLAAQRRTRCATTSRTTPPGAGCGARGWRASWTRGRRRTCKKRCARAARRRCGCCASPGMRRRTLRSRTCSPGRSSGRRWRAARRRRRRTRRGGPDAASGWWRSPGSRRGRRPHAPHYLGPGALATRVPRLDCRSVPPTLSRRRAVPAHLGASFRVTPRSARCSRIYIR